jgi:hypothetical protein
MGRTGRALAAVLVAAALAASTASAARPQLSWRAAQVLDGTQQARQPHVAITGDGEVLFAWLNAGRVLTERQLPSGSIIRQTLTPQGPATAQQVLLATSPRGAALVTWLDVAGQVHAAYRARPDSRPCRCPATLRRARSRKPSTPAVTW